MNNVRTRSEVLSAPGVIVVVEQLETGVYRVVVNGQVVATDTNGTVLRNVLQALPRT